VDKFLSDIAGDYGSAKKNITPEALEALKKITWTGNIRELRNVTERLVIMCGGTITEEDVKKYTEMD